MEKNDFIFKVTNDNGRVEEFFPTRRSAINYIIDEFAMACVYHTETESERLAEYMEIHDATPKQYPYSYTIEKIKLNREYDY